MSQRQSGWERKTWDQYETPEWVTRVILDHFPRGGVVWEPSCGSGNMLAVLGEHFDEVVATDAQSGDRFQDFKCPGTATKIIANPPYDQAQEFVEHALNLLEPCGGSMAFLLRVDFDSAKTRQHLFVKHPAWAKKVVLLKRIMWFPGGKSPSYNHAWYYWDWRHQGAPTIAYGPLE